MPEPLTKLERRILDYLVDYLRRHTFQPSIREIGRRFDIKSTKTVAEHLQSLADKGWIERDPSRSRGVRLLSVNLRPSVVTVPCYDDGSSAGGAAADTLDLDRKLAGRNGTFFVRVHGDSMEAAGIHDGDRVLVEPVPEDELRDGDLVAARVGGEVTVKRYFSRRGAVVLEPANPDYAPTLVSPAAELAVLGRVTGVFRRLGAAEDGVEGAAAATRRVEEGR